MSGTSPDISVHPLPIQVLHPDQTEVLLRPPSSVRYLQRAGADGLTDQNSDPESVILSVHFP